MRRLSLNAAVVLTGLLVLPTPSRAIILSGSGGNGDGSFGITTSPEYSGVVGVLNRKRDGNLSTEGTGALIDRTHVLTCAHVLGRDSGPEPPQDCFVMVGGVVHPVAAIAVHPEFNPAAQSADLAVLTLATPAPPRVQSYAWNHGELDELRIGKCTLVGLGQSGSAEHGINPELPAGVKRVATNTVDFISTGENSLTRPDGSPLRLAPHSMVLDFDDHRTPEVNGHRGEVGVHPHVPGSGTSDPTEGITCPGDSGGPLFQLDPRDGRRVIVGVGSSGGGPFHGGIGDHAVFMRVAPFSKWIKEIVGTVR